MKPETYKILFVDTETTGICDMRMPYTPETLESVWPNITELSFKVLHFTKDFVSATAEPLQSYLIKPTYPREKILQEITDITGITYDILLNEGTDLSVALNHFINELNTSDFVVAHNTTFDMKMIKAECLRLNIDQHMRVCPWIDTMYHGNSFCNLRNSRGGRKFPTLSELYHKVTDSTPPSSHRASADVETLITCFSGLFRHNILTPERIALRLAKHVSTETVSE